MIKLPFEIALYGGSFYNRNNQLVFDPPVYEQRYMVTAQILEHKFFAGKIKKVVEFGCAEMKFVNFLRRIKGVEHIIEIDIDENILSQSLCQTNPLICDHLNKREYPLRIEIYRGSIGSTHPCLQNTDAIIAIELIEHLYPQVFENIPYVIFGYMNPKLIIFTTPNSEFNVVFGLEANQFRHHDHKFEWDRQQFSDWCENICLRFPNYKFSIIGIGRGQPEQIHLGCVSQMAIFIRQDLLDDKLTNNIDNLNCLSYNDELKLIDDIDYKLLHLVDFPYNPDNRTPEQKILDESKYHLATLMNLDRYRHHDKNHLEIPLVHLYERLQLLTNRINELKTILLNAGYIINEYDFIETELPEQGYIPEDSDDEFFTYDVECDQYELTDGINDDIQLLEINDNNNSTTSSPIVVHEIEENWD